MRYSKSWFLLLWVTVSAATNVLGCSGSHPPPPNLPAPVLSTTVGPGDSLKIWVVGEKDWATEFTVNPDGTIDFPHFGTNERYPVAGLEPQQIVDMLKAKLAEAKIYPDAQINLLVEKYASKKVNIIGQVQKPGSVPWTDGIKLFEAIAALGGFTSIADSNHVILTRQTAPGKSTTVTISVDAISEGSQPDILLQAGDSIKVDARVF